MVIKILVFLYSKNPHIYIYIYGFGKSRTIEKCFFKKRTILFRLGFKTYGLNVLNLQPVLAGSTLGYRHTASDLLKMSELKKGSLNTFPLHTLPLCYGVYGKEKSL